MNARPIVNFFDALKTCLCNYASFKGRIRRSEYWWFMLVINLITVLLITLLILYVGRVIGGKVTYRRSSYPYPYDRDDYYIRISSDGDAILALIIVICVYVSLVGLPVLSATARRLHDVGKRGEYMFIVFVPFFGGLTLLVLLCLDSHPNSNKYGPSPKYGSMDFDKNMELNPLTNQMITNNDFNIN